MASLVCGPCHDQLLRWPTAFAWSSASSSYNSSTQLFFSGAELGSTHYSGGLGGSGEPRRPIGVRATGVDSGRIGSRRRKGGQGASPNVPKETFPLEERPREPFLETRTRIYREEGHRVLDDAEALLEKANNSFGLVLQIAAEANEYLRNNKDESLKRKPILKVISDRVNEVYGENIRDSYINDKPDFSEYES